MFRSMKLSTRLAAISCVGVVGLALAACSTAASTSPASSTTGSVAATSAAPAALTPVTVTLNYLAGGPNAGFMVAQAKGYYTDAGLDVKIQEGQGSGSTASLVAQGNSQFGFADAPSAMAVTSKGGDLVNIAQVLQTNGFSVMSLEKSGIKTIGDLKGKSVALQPGTAQASLFDAVLAANGVDKASMNIINIDPSALVATLLQGKVDAITAGADSQAVQLRDQGAVLNEVLYRDAGVPTVGLSIIAQASYAKANPKIASAFVEASLRGFDDVRKDSKAAADIVAKAFPAGAVAKSIVEQADVDIKLYCSAGSPGLGEVSPETWSATYDLLVKYLALPTTSPITAYYTNDYLPKALPAC
jgi:NitT/TauT family transport system substrate-binding protein